MSQQSTPARTARTPRRTPHPVRALFTPTQPRTDTWRCGPCQTYNAQNLSVCMVCEHQRPAH